MSRSINMYCNILWYGIYAIPTHKLQYHEGNTITMSEYLWEKSWYTLRDPIKGYLPRVETTIKNINALLSFQGAFSHASRGQATARAVTTVGSKQES